MEVDKIRTALEDIFQDVLGLEKKENLVHLKYGEDANWDSLGFMEIVVNIEVDFNISFESWELDKMKTFDAFFTVVKSKLDADDGHI